MAAIANSSKKRKVDVEGRLFKASWTVDYFVMERFGRIMCLICQETISVPKEYNVKRHFLTKHGDRYDSLTGQVRLDRVNSLQQSVVGQQSLFTAVSKSSEASTKVSFLLAEAIAKRGKAFSDGEFVKECLGLFTSVVCPEKKSEVEKISLSHQTVETFPNLAKHARRHIALFGSTYCCEQFFSRLKNVKIKTRSVLTNDHLSGILRIATSTVAADIEFLCKQKQCQISH